MNKILSPLNVASLIILILIVTLCDKSIRRERKLEHEQQVNAQVTYLDNISPTDFISSVNDKLPATYSKWMKPHFTEATLCADTLVFTVDNGDPDIANPYGWGYISVGASDPLTGSVIMLSDVIGSDKIDYIFYNGYNIAIDTYARGKLHVHFVIPAADVRGIYRGPDYGQRHPAPLADLPME